MPFPHLLGNAALFFGTVFGLGFLWWRRTAADGLERLTWAAALGLAQLYAGAWLIYLTGAPREACLALPLLGVAGLLGRWRELRALFAQGDGAAAAGRLLLFSGWCVGWLSLVRCYGGGEWMGDWIEHYDRARYFLDHQPLETRFLGIYSITSRPPLANLAIGALMGAGDPGFPSAQLFLTLWSSLIVLPALLLVRGFGGGPRAEAWLLAVLMFSPFVVQNATFAWTKFPCAFFVLAAIAWYRRGVEAGDEAQRTRAVGLMALGVLVHYSAAPYAIALTVLHLGWLWRARRLRAAGSELLAQSALAAGVLATWLAWAWWHFGATGAFLDNPSVTSEAGLSLAARAGHRLQSVWVTLVPHVFRAADYRYIAQASEAGYLRDQLFNIYQTTLLGFAGLGGLALAVLAWWHRRRAPAVRVAGGFWGWLAGIVAVLSLATVPGADRWGVAHIGFGPLFIILFAFLAARAAAAPPRAAAFWLVAAAADAAGGIVLHFKLQTIMPSMLDVQRSLQGELSSYAPAVARNGLAKLLAGVEFVGDRSPSPVLVSALLAALAMLAVTRLFAPPPGAPAASPAPHGR